MKRFESGGPNGRRGRQVAATAALCMITMALAASWMTAGPGNWARLERQGIVLPTVTVVGKREMPKTEPSATASAQPGSALLDSPF